MNQRSNILQHAKKQTTPWDLVIIGGGANGLGCAWQAIEKGYKVLLVDKGDFSSGSSSKSTKLLHGGVRYLEQGNISLVKEALKERKLLLEKFSSCSWKKEILIPFGSYIKGFYFWIGMKLYDFLSGSQSIGPSSWLSKEQFIKAFPNISSQKLKAGISYYDGQFDDSMMCAQVVSAINLTTSKAINYVEANSFIFENGKIIGVKLKDSEKGIEWDVLSKVVINATGVESDQLIEKAESKTSKNIVSSKGAHIVVDDQFGSTDQAVLIPRTPDGRVVFMIPWMGKLLIGTTDTPTDDLTTSPSLSQHDIDYLLETANPYLKNKISRKDIRSAFVGLRTLVKPKKSKNTKSISRSHLINKTPSGLINVIGGKWTTFRKIGEDCMKYIDRKGVLPASERNDIELKFHNLIGPQDGQLLHERLPYSESQIIDLMKDSMVVHADDLLARRTRCLFLDFEASEKISSRVIDLMQNIFNFDQEWRIAEEKRLQRVFKEYNPKPS